jgi:hypothetical protein
MSGSSVADFIEALKTDPDLKNRVLEAQRQGSANIQREADAIAAIAAEAGFDLGDWARRPADGRPEPVTEDEKTLPDDCSATCCLVATSTAW